MNALEILFETNRFNLSEVKPHFVNPCCFGEDLAAWLRARLDEKGVETREPYQEDWGWELPTKSGTDSYYLCMSGNSDELPSDKNQGEWRIIVEKRRSFRQRLSGSGKIGASEVILGILQQILSADPAIRNVRLIDERQAQRAYSA